MPTLRTPTNTGVSGTSFSVSKPTGTSSGDLMIAFQLSDSVTSSMAISGGSSWTVIYTHASVGEKIYAKIAGASEPSTYPCSQGSSAVGGMIHLISIANPINTTLPTALKSSDTTSTSIDTPSLTSVGSADIDLRWVPVQLPSSVTSDYSLSGIPSGYSFLAGGFRSDPTSGWHRLSSDVCKRDTPPVGSTGVKTFVGNQSVTDSGYSILIPSLLATTGFTGWGMPI